MSYIIFGIISLIRIAYVVVYFEINDRTVKGIKYILALLYAGFTPFLLHLVLQLIDIIQIN